MDIEMDRRTFLSGGAAAASAGSAAAQASGLAPLLAAMPVAQPLGLDPGVHRFGVNYTPSRNWWFCWNDWNADPIKRDLDAVAALGADHMRIMLIWPFFQPNATFVSPLHLERLDQLLTLMGERRLDALVTAFTGQLSGLYFM